MTVSDSDDRHLNEDVQRGTTDLCPECGGYVPTNSGETVCEDCGFIIDDQAVARGPTLYVDDETTKQTYAALTPALLKPYSLDTIYGGTAHM